MCFGLQQPSEGIFSTLLVAGIGDPSGFGIQQPSELIFYFACCWNCWWLSSSFVCLFVCPCVCAPVCMSGVRVWDWLCWQAILILTSHFGFFGTYWQTQLILLGDLSKITSITFICHGCGCVSSHSCVHANVKYKIMAPFVGMKIINKRKNN